MLLMIFIVISFAKCQRRHYFSLALADSFFAKFYSIPPKFSKTQLTSISIPIMRTLLEFVRLTVHL